MKLIIQIPCLNEEDSLPITLADLPREVPGFDSVEWLVVDDGSQDRTVEVAIENGVDHILRLSSNKGLAVAFPAGIRRCAELGADVVVNTDADNQYQASCIPALVAPILNEEADIVIGARPIGSINHFSPLKKVLQYLGSAAVRWASGTNVKDAPSGFRAMSIEQALRLNVYNNYTYTIETIIQAGHRNMRVTNVDVAVNGDLRPSRLFKSIRVYVQRNMLTIIRFFVIYKPLRFFLMVSAVPIFVAFILFGRFGLYYSIGLGSGKVQSLIVATASLMLGGILVSLGIIGDILAINRRKIEDLHFEVLWQRILRLRGDESRP